MILDTLNYNKERHTPNGKPTCTESSVVINNRKIRILHDKKELHVFYDFLSDYTLQSWLEVGVFNGGGIYIWKELLSDTATIVGIDNKIVQTPISSLIRKDQQGSIVYCDLSDTSRAKYEISAIRNGFDAIFIDASHKYDAVKRDFETFSDMAEQLIIIHDIYRYDKDAGRFWNEIKESYDYVEIPNENKVIGYGIIKL